MVTFATRKLAIYNRPVDELRRQRIIARKEKHTHFKEIYMAWKKLNTEDTLLEHSYGEESKFE